MWVIAIVDAVAFAASSSPTTAGRGGTTSVSLAVSSITEMQAGRLHDGLKMLSMQAFAPRAWTPPPPPPPVPPPRPLPPRPVPPTHVSSSDRSQHPPDQNPNELELTLQIAPPAHGLNEGALMLEQEPPPPPLATLQPNPRGSMLLHSYCIGCRPIGSR